MHPCTHLIVGKDFVNFQDRYSVNEPLQVEVEFIGLKP